MLYHHVHKDPFALIRGVSKEPRSSGEFSYTLAASVAEAQLACFICFVVLFSQVYSCSHPTAAVKH